MPEPEGLLSSQLDSPKSLLHNSSLESSKQDTADIYLERFHLPDDPHLGQKLHRFNEGFLSLKQAHPEIVSGIIYGSQVKGYATENSDIDINLVINADLLPDDFQGFKDSLDKRNNLPNNVFPLSLDHLDPEEKKIEEFYKKLIRQQYGKLYPEYEIQRIYLVNKSLIKRAVASFAGNSMCSTQNNITEQRVDQLKDLFGLNMSNEIARYQQSVLDEIQLQTAQANAALEKGDSFIFWRYDPEVYWQSMVTGMKFWDRGVKYSPYSVPMDTYPKTIEEARLNYPITLSELLHESVY